MFSSPLSHTRIHRHFIPFINPFAVAERTKHFFYFHLFCLAYSKCLLTFMDFHRFRCVFCFFRFVHTTNFFFLIFFDTIFFFVFKHSKKNMENVHDINLYTLVAILQNAEPRRTHRQSRKGRKKHVWQLQYHASEIY